MASPRDKRPRRGDRPAREKRPPPAERTAPAPESTRAASIDAPTVRLEREGAIAVVTLDRPEKRNALSPREHQALQAIAAELRSDFTTRVVILTGAGQAFSAGADLANPREAGTPQNDLERRHRARIGDRTVAALEALDQITIAAINGPCVGGGAVLALACDLRVMQRDAWLSIPEVEIGMPLTWGALPLLMREIGPARTIELVTTCERVDAASALAYGLVNHVVPPPVAARRGAARGAGSAFAARDGALGKALAIAARIVAQPAVPVAMTKTTVRALRTTAASGDVTAADGDLYWLAIKLGGLRVTGPPRSARHDRRR